MFFSSKLNKFKNVKHCFFSRRNGYSDGIYKGLNCGKGSDDKKENVLKNLNFVSKKIGCEDKFLITLKQTHSNKAIFVKNKNVIKDRLIGDAIVTKEKNIGISILTADCAPIFFYDPKNKIIGCAHSGWRGALNGIIKNTVKKFNDLNSNSDDLIAVVGPCIKKENYEVKDDFVKQFTNKSQKFEKFFYNKENRIFFDLRGYINNEILSLKIKNIENIELDTFSEKELFYSCRRSRFNNEPDYGRCISVILVT